MIVDIFKGINATILAYGQTGSGKTFSICGGESFDDRGLIPRTINIVFDELGVRGGMEDTTFKCLISFTEVFGESVYDLLDPMKSTQALEDWTKVQIMEGDEGLTLRNVNVFEVSSEEDALNLFFMGTTNRATSSTPMNHASSRSHAIFTIVVESESRSGTKLLARSGKVNLVDLAGSERLYKVENSKSMIKEGKSINLSLHFLEKVIVSLRDQAKKMAAANLHHRHQNRGSFHDVVGANGSVTNAVNAAKGAVLVNGGGVTKLQLTNGYGHIPYRNSVLTSILRDSLGGNCKSCFLITLAAEEDHFEESVSTARFGQRCGEIQVKVSANVEVDLNSRIHDLQQALKRLQHDMAIVEEEKANLLLALEEKTSEIEGLQDNNTRPVSEEDLAICQVAASMIASAMRHNESDNFDPVHPSVRHVIEHELSDLRPPMAHEVIRLVVDMATEMLQEAARTTIAYQNRLHHAALQKGMSMSTIDSKEDEFFTASVRPVELDITHPSLRIQQAGVEDSRTRPPSPMHTQYLAATSRTLSRDPSMYTFNTQTSAADHTRGESGKSIPDSLSGVFPGSSATCLHRDSTGASGWSRKTKLLIEGATVISHGHYGNYKVKYCFVSKDLQTIFWKDMFEKREPKSMPVNECSNFRVETESQCFRIKTPGGVMLSFTDDSNKTHEFEFPCQAMTSEENEKRVLKWVELLSEVKDGKRNWMDDSQRDNQQAFAHSPEKRSSQLVSSRSQSGASIGRFFGM
ncbi:KIF6 [Symbiodinium microadriaticum]|nr:KIF6 [Symbiodinium microadriaticum]